MDEHDQPQNDQEYPEVRHRLQAFGAAPLRPGLADTTLEHVRAGGRRKVGGARLKLISAAAIAGFAAAGVGLAAADVLPGPVQDAAHTTLASVGVHVPPGHIRYNDPTICPGGPYRNHGAYVRSHKDDPNAGKSPCGKPLQSVGASGTSKDDDNTDADGATGDTGHGPPIGAHGTGKTDKRSDAGEKAKPAKPSSTNTRPTATTASTGSTTSTSTSSTTSTTMQS